MLDSLSRIKGILYRNFLWAYRSPFRLADVFIWPLVMLFTLILFLSAIGGDLQYLGLLVLAVIGWKCLFFVCFETTAVFIEAHWNGALPNLLASPINSIEIAIGGALTGVLKTFAMIVLVTVICSLLYGFTMVDPLTFMIAMAFLMLAAFSIGFLLFGFSCYFDKRNIFTLSFVVPELVGLVSGPYYDVAEVFPDWLASIINIFPTTHAFNLIKSIYGVAEADYFMLVGTTLLWLVIAIVVNKAFYELGRKKGTLVKVG